MIKCRNLAVWSLKNQHIVKTVPHRSHIQGERHRNRKRKIISCFTAMGQQATGTGVISGQQALACACTAIIKDPPGSTPTTRLCFCHTATRQSTSLPPFEPQNKSFFLFIPNPALIKYNERERGAAAVGARGTKAAAKRRKRLIPSL